MIRVVASLIPPWAWAAGAAIALASAWAWHAADRAAAVHAARRAVHAEYQARASAAEHEHRRLEQRRQSMVEEVHRAHLAATSRDRAAAARLAGERFRLLELLGADRGGAAGDARAATGADDPGVLRDVLRECVVALGAVAGEADRLETKVTGLQGYVNAVCRPAPE